MEGVKRKSLIFFFGVSRLFFFFFGVSRVWRKKPKKCMIRDLRFFCDATYTKKKSYVTYAFFDTRPTAKKKNKRVTLFFLYIKKRVTLFFLIKKRVTPFFYIKKRVTLFFLIKKRVTLFF